uniref:Uncharacterized protein n=1 Tax=Knipowitschia caucasica TaxID=637954 RepID=A0AAV2IXG9_KNICA
MESQAVNWQLHAPYRDLAEWSYGSQIFKTVVTLPGLFELIVRSYKLLWLCSYGDTCSGPGAPTALKGTGQRNWPDAHRGQDSQGESNGAHLCWRRG